MSSNKILRDRRESLVSPERLAARTVVRLQKLAHLCYSTSAEEDSTRVSGMSLTIGNKLRCVYLDSRSSCGYLQFCDEQEASRFASDFSGLLGSTKAPGVQQAELCTAETIRPLLARNFLAPCTAQWDSANASHWSLVMDELQRGSGGPGQQWSLVHRMQPVDPAAKSVSSDALESKLVTHIKAQDKNWKRALGEHEAHSKVLKECQDLLTEMAHQMSELRHSSSSGEETTLLRREVAKLSAATVTHNLEAMETAERRALVAEQEAAWLSLQLNSLRAVMSCPQPQISSSTDTLDLERLLGQQSRLLQASVKKELQLTRDETSEAFVQHASVLLAKLVLQVKEVLPASIEQHMGHLRGLSGLSLQPLTGSSLELQTSQLLQSEHCARVALQETLLNQLEADYMADLVAAQSLHLAARGQAQLKEHFADNKSLLATVEASIQTKLEEIFRGNEVLVSRLAWAMESKERSQEVIVKLDEAQLETLATKLAPQLEATAAPAAAFLSQHLLDLNQKFLAQLPAGCGSRPAPLVLHEAQLEELLGCVTTRLQSFGFTENKVEAFASRLTSEVELKLLGFTAHLKALQAGLESKVEQYAKSAGRAVNLSKQQLEHLVKELVANVRVQVPVELPRQHVDFISGKMMERVRESLETSGRSLTRHWASFEQRIGQSMKASEKTSEQWFEAQRGILEKMSSHLERPPDAHQAPWKAHWSILQDRLISSMLANEATITSAVSSALQSFTFTDAQIQRLVATLKPQTSLAVDEVNLGKLLSKASFEFTDQQIEKLSAALLLKLESQGIQGPGGGEFVLRRTRGVKMNGEA
eukprot:RCo043236